MKQKILILTFLFFSTLSFCQDVEITTDIFNVIYSEKYEQPLIIFYEVECPYGEESRGGLDFKLYDGVHTSDDDDYKNNEWDKGHLAPAASFNCDRETLSKTFTFLNCTLQHEGLNRGPWKELEEFERNLAKIYDKVLVEITCHFSESSLQLPTGATVPDGFTKIIMWDERIECFYFPNEDISGIDWYQFRVDD